MKASFAILLIALLTVLLKAGEESPSPNAEERRKTMLTVIQKLGDIRKSSIHQWLRDASVLLGTHFDKVPFWEAVKVAEDLKLPLIEGWENGSAIHRQYRLGESVFKCGDGKAADAFLFFSSLNQKEARMPFVATTVYGARIGLLIDVGMPYESVIKRKVFPAGTALDRALALEEVVDSGGPWPLLDRMTISYGLLFDRWREHHPSGFDLEVKFVASRNKDVGNKSISCSVASGLDPQKDFQGHPVEKAHQSADTLGELRYHGGNESWSGSPEEIDRNKAVLLRATAEKSAKPQKSKEQ